MDNQPTHPRVEDFHQNVNMYVHPEVPTGILMQPSWHPPPPPTHTRPAPQTQTDATLLLWQFWAYSDLCSKQPRVLQEKELWSDVEGRWLHFDLATKAMRLILLLTVRHLEAGSPSHSFEYRFAGSLPPAPVYTCRLFGDGQGGRWLLMRLIRTCLCHLPDDRSALDMDDNDSATDPGRVFRDCTNGIRNIVCLEVSSWTARSLLGSGGLGLGVNGSKCT